MVGGSVCSEGSSFLAFFFFFFFFFFPSSVEAFSGVSAGLSATFSIFP